MNVFLACFLAVIFARIVGTVLNHQLGRWYIAWSMRRAGVKIAREMRRAGIKPMQAGDFVVGTATVPPMFSGPSFSPPSPAELQAFHAGFQQTQQALVAVIRTAARVGDLANQVANPTKPGVVVDLSLSSAEQDQALSELVEAAAVMRQVIPDDYLECAYGVPRPVAAQQEPVSGEITCDCPGDHASAPRHLRSVDRDPKDAA